MNLQKWNLLYLKQSCQDQMDTYIAEGKDKEVEGIFALFGNVFGKILMFNFI